MTKTNAYVGYYKLRKVRIKHALTRPLNVPKTTTAQGGGVTLMTYSITDQLLCYYSISLSLLLLHFSEDLVLGSNTRHLRMTEKTTTKPHPALDTRVGSNGTWGVQVVLKWST